MVEDEDAETDNGSDTDDEAEAAEDALSSSRSWNAAAESLNDPEGVPASMLWWEWDDLESGLFSCTEYDLSRLSYDGKMRWRNNEYNWKKYIQRKTLLQ